MRLKAWTGPCLVKVLASHIRDAGVMVTIEGTEHVYVEVPHEVHHVADFETRKMIAKRHGTAFGLQFRPY